MSVTSQRGPGRARRPRLRPDHDPFLWATLALCAAVLAGTAGQLIASVLGGPALVGFALAGLAGGLAVTVNTATPLRTTAVGICSVTVFTHLRMGGVGTSLFTGPNGAVLLMALVVVALVVADRLATDESAPLRGSILAPQRGAVFAMAGAAVAAVTVLALVAAPWVLPWVSSTTAAGQGPTLEALSGSGGPIRASSSLDMTGRPSLTDAVVFTVDADRATFWRGQTYDLWDGRTWSQSRPGRFALEEDGRLTHLESDLGAGGDDTLTQRFRMEAGYSEVLFAAATALQVQAGTEVLQGEDATLVTGDLPLGRGAAYTVVSRRITLSDDRLRQAEGPIPQEILDRYAAAPDTTDRVRKAALEATAGQATRYDRIRALERFMGRTTTYSLDAPLSPGDVDVVDHFLFTARQGWCEQVASSLVVMARVNGIPARLVTGYVPGEAKPFTGTYVVREKDAHAWAEVWFPEVGWVAFDPTASVPLAGADQAQAPVGRWLVDNAVTVVGGLALACALVWSTVVLVRRVRRRRASRPVGWPAVTEVRLAELGRRARRPWPADQTATTYATGLGLHLGAPRSGEVGRAVDQALYSPVPPDAAVMAEVDALLDHLDTLVSPNSRAHGRAGADP